MRRLAVRGRPLCSAGAPFPACATSGAAVRVAAVGACEIRPTPGRLGVVFALLLLAAPAGAVPLSEVDRDFSASAQLLERATVLVRGVGAEDGFPGSSGVVVHPDGYILSDADATVTRITEVSGRGFRKDFVDKATVRFPDGKVFRAALIRRDEPSDSALLRIEDAGEARFKALRPGRSDALDVGSWALLCGNAFGTGSEGRPAVSLGVVSATRSRMGGDGAGRHALLVTSAAVNPGSNGGPCADAEGRLVGIVSTWGTRATSPWYGLGIVTPLARIRARYKDLPAAAKAFPEPQDQAPRARGAAAMEEAFRVTARLAAPAVVSITFRRAAGAVRTEEGKGADGKPAEIEAYQGPVSGVVYSADGYVVTSAYNLWAPERILGAEVHLRDGRNLPARLLGRDQVRGIALLKMEAEGLPCLAPAPADQVRVGQFAFALGNPEGPRPSPRPFFTFGVLGALHQLDRNRDALQTDAGMNDANAGGALVDLRGRLLGINTLLAPARFGRNSGIGFAIPVSKIEEALPGLKLGRNVVPAYLGVQLKQAGPGKVVLEGVLPGGAALKAGLGKDDLVIAFNGEAVESLDQLRDMIGALMAGDTVVVSVIRDGEQQEIVATLGERPPE